MTKITFKRRGELLYGFEVSGHAGSDDYGKDIVCAAVSSAVYLVSNTMMDNFEIGGKYGEDYVKNVIFVEVAEDEAAVLREDGDRLLNGLLNHMLQLSEQYPENVRVIVE